jgi:multidrug efflux system membrane fusion protein
MLNSRLCPSQRQFNAFTANDSRKYGLRLGAWLLLAVVGIAAPLSAAELEAELQWARKVVLGTPVSGVVTAVRVSVGERVEAGQALVQLDDRVYRAQVAAREAELKRAANDRDEAQRELDRTQELYDRTLLADHDLTLAKIQRDATEAGYLSAQAALIRVRLELDYSTLRAPFAGRVLRRTVETGQIVVNALRTESLVVVVETEHMLARASVSAAQLKELEPGARVTVVVAGREHRGSVRGIGLEPVATDRYAIDVVFATGDRLYRVGQPAKVRLP